MRRILLALCALVALAAVGCGGGSSSGSSGTSSAPASTSSSGGGAVTIKMQNIAFDPKSTTVKVGQKVTWVNDDTVDHNVTANSGDFKSKTFGKGGSFTFTPTKAGTIKYVCTIHPGMTATLTVQ